jgi:hypothetical protein
MKGTGWNMIVTSRDLLLDVEQEEVGMVVDMELAWWAAVFIGNGVSFSFLGFFFCIANCSRFVWFLVVLVHEQHHPPAARQRVGGAQYSLDVECAARCIHSYTARDTRHDVQCARRETRDL